MTEVQLPDGRSINFPEGMPIEAMTREVKRFLGSDAPSVPVAGPDITSERLDTRSTTLGELTGGLADRGLFTAVGGIGGSVIGGGAAIPTGPGALAAGVAGGALGAAAGSAVYDNVNDFLRSVGVLGGQPKPTGQIASDALNEGVTDAEFGMAAPLMTPILWARRIGAKVLGVGKEDAVRARELAERFGINLSAVDVGNGFSKGYAKVVGIFPWTGTPIRAAYKDKLDQSTEAAEKLLDSLAPNAHLVSDLGVGMTRAAENSFKEFNRVAGTLYDDFRKTAYAAGDIVPTENTRGLAQELAQRASAGQITLNTQDKLGAPISEPVQQYIGQLQNLPERLTVQQYERVVDDFQALLKKGAMDGFDVKQVVQMKKALEADLNAIQGSPEIVEKLRTANAFYSKGIAQFQTPTAQRIGRVEKNLFEAGRQDFGALNADELADVVVNLKSPQAIRDLRTLVGDDLVNQAARIRVQRAVDVASDTLEIGGQQLRYIKADVLERELGLSGRKAGREGEGFEELLRTSGIKPSDLQDFTKALRTIEDISDPSEFLKRRVTLGGAGAIAGAMGLGAVAGNVAGGALISTTAVVSGLLSRYGAKVISNPQMLKDMTTAIGDQVALSPRRSAVLRLLKAVPEEDANAQ